MKNKKSLAILLLTIALVLGAYFLGFSRGGGIVTPLTQEEVSKIQDNNAFQFIPKDVDLDFALEGGHYVYCLSYPGLGVSFSGYDENQKLIVGESPRTYPAFGADLLPGMKVVTPIDILRGDINTPVKVEFESDKGIKSVILKRVMVKKCLKKQFVESVPHEWIEKNRSKFEL